VAGNKNQSVTGSHIPVLDGLRALAILLVICFHFQQGIRLPWWAKLRFGGKPAWISSSFFPGF